MATKFNYEKYTKAYAILNAQKENIENDMKVIKEKLKEAVLKEENQKAETKYATVYFAKGSTRETVDLDTIKTENKKLYDLLKKNGYIKETVVKPAFKVNCKSVLVETTSKIV